MYLIIFEGILLLTPSYTEGNNFIHIDEYIEMKFETEFKIKELKDFADNAFRLLDNIKNGYDIVKRERFGPYIINLNYDE